MSSARSPRARRAVPALALALCLAALPTLGGCSIVEVIDNIGKDPKAEAAAKQKQAEADAAAAAPAGGSGRDKLRAYYNRKPAKQVVEDPNNPIVTCRLPTGKHFMRKQECVQRGGRAVGAA